MLELAVLGLLKERAMHGYELKRQLGQLPTELRAADGDTPPRPLAEPAVTPGVGRCGAAAGP